MVEDEPVAAGFLRQGLTEEGYAVDVAEDADTASERVALHAYDAILLDVMLPGRDGFALCREWRAAGVSSPILFLTARDDVRDRVAGLDGGGDDYLVKPYAFEELLARIRSLLRRSQAERTPPTLRCGDLRIDTNAKRVWRGEKEVALTVREYQMLEFFAYRAGAPVSRTQLWEHVWETGGEPDSNVVDVYVGYLRHKLGRERIETVRGVGYRLRREDPRAG